MSARYGKEWVASMMDAEGRFGSQSSEDLLAETGLGCGQTAVDLGCGPGLRALSAAAIVAPTGKIYAIDTEPSMLDQVNIRVWDAGITNIETVRTNGIRVPLSVGIADYAICSLVLHFPPEVTGRVDMAKDIAHLLKPDGQSLWIEWTLKEGGDPANCLGQDETTEVLTVAGFDCGLPRPIDEKQFAIAATRSR